jgi:hypothetical protein
MCVLDKKKVRSQIWHPKPMVNNDKREDGSSASMNMVFSLQ